MPEVFRPSTTGADCGATVTRRCCCGASEPQATAPHTATAIAVAQSEPPASDSEAITTASTVSMPKITRRLPIESDSRPAIRFAAMPLAPHSTSSPLTSRVS